MEGETAWHSIEGAVSAGSNLKNKNFAPTTACPLALGSTPY